MYSVILAVDDNIDRSLGQAKAVADLRDDPQDLHITVAYAFSFKSPDDDLRDLQSVQEVTAFFDDRGIEYDLVDAQAEPASFIVEAAESRDADVICVGGRKRTPASKVLFGSVSQQVLLNANRPVLVAQEPSTGETEQ